MAFVSDATLNALDSGAEMLRDVLQHGFHGFKDAPVRYSQDAKALGKHVRVTGLIVMPSLVWFMRGPIALNN